MHGTISQGALGNKQDTKHQNITQVPFDRLTRGHLPACGHRLGQPVCV